MYQPQGPASAIRRVRRALRVISVWAFSVAVTVLLVGVWGKAVAADEGTLAESARAALTTDVVADRIEGWLEDAIVAGGGSAGPEVTEIVAEVRETPEADAALGNLVDQAVSAALAPQGASRVIDVSGAAWPLAPVISQSLQDRAYDVSTLQVRLVMLQVPAVTLDTEEFARAVDIVADARTLLTNAVAAGLAAMLVAGIGALALAEERIRMVRSLATRLAVSALTFALLLRLGQWIVDPNGGGSALAKGGAVLLGSNGAILFVIAAIAAVPAIGAALLARVMRTRGAAAPV